MKIVETRLLRGPNAHSPRPALMAVLDLGPLDDVSSVQIPGFVDRLLALIPTLFEHRCSRGHRGGFVERLREGTYMAHVTEHVLIELQCLAGPIVGFGKARAVRGVAGRYRIVCSYAIEPLAVTALPLAVEIVETLARGEDVADLPARIEPLRAIARRQALGPSTRAIIEAAAARGIPVMRLSQDTSLIQLGWGARAERIRATITGRTSHVAVEIASDKQLTKALLADAGVPVPRGEAVRDVEQAVAAMRRLRGPVVVKPLDGNHGKGVTVGVRDEAGLRAAYERAAARGRRVIVESHVGGEDHRVLVVGGRVLAAARRRPPCVVGDGARSVRALVEAENRDNPLRGDGHANALTRIPLDAGALEELARQAMDFDSVPPPGVEVRLRGNANLSTGGTAEDVTARLHGAVAAACVRAARVVGLDVAGVDVVCRDIARPLAAQRGAIVEVNAAPGIRMHERPSRGRAQPAGAAIVEALFAGGADGRIPVIAVTGSNGKTTTTLAIASVCRAAGLVAGVTTTEGVFIDGQPIARGDCTGYWSARTVLAAPEVQVAVLETARGGMLKRGLAFDRCAVGVVLNVQGDHLGLDGIDTMAQLARVKALVARTASQAAVLNADDAHCRAMAAELAAGCRAVLFSMRPPAGPAHPERALPERPDHADADAAARALAEHLARGERAAWLDHDHTIVLAEGPTRRIPLVLADRLAMTVSGLARHNIANAVAAAAAAWAAGLSTDAIRSGLVAFQPDASANPLRLNLFRAGDTTVVMDYAHNAAACAAIVATARALATGRVVGIVSAPGDRRDDEIRAVGHAAGSGFDEVVSYEKDDPRGRAPGEIARCIGDGALAAGMDPARLHVVIDQSEAIRRGLALCGRDDLLVYAGATDVSELQEALPDPIVPLVVVERRDPRVPEPATSDAAAGGAAGTASGTAPREPGTPSGAPFVERRVVRRPYLVAAASAPSSSPR